MLMLFCDVNIKFVISDLCFVYGVVWLNSNFENLELMLVKWEFLDIYMY